MGYRIEYEGGTLTKKAIKKTKIKPKPVLLSITAAAIAAMLFWPAGRLWVRNLLLPGDEEVTAAALSGLVEDLSAGEPVGEAVEAFCREIIDGDES